MTAAAEAYSNAIHKTSVPARPHRSNVVPLPTRQTPKVSRHPYAVVPNVAPVSYRPSVSISMNPIWDRLDVHTRDWMAAILSAKYATDRFFKMAVNAVCGHTGCTVSEANELCHKVRGLTYDFSPAERAAIRHYWAEALYVDRYIPMQTNGVNAYLWSL